MSNIEADNDNRPDGNGAGPTRSFDGSVVGPGRQIGHFRIEREIGRGGAGVVYLAHDTKLGRRVAIKSLPVELMRDAHMRSRLQREAKLLASLDHPNIATIHDIVEQAESGGYLILEYIEGDTLAERIARKPLNLSEVLPIAQQIAEAVAAAHEHGVTHRDLKPGNIKITPAGKVKVLDFGLAKAVAGEATDQQSTITEPGRVMGTPAYMSPEQARGQETDKRCDIWSFGCVLYEMLTGKVPFEGETASDTLACILEREPDWHALPQAVPHNIQVLLRRCLQKDPRRRLRDIGDAGIEISETLTGSRSASMVPAAAPGKREPVGLRRMMVLAVVCVSLGAVAATVITWNLKRPIPRPSYRLPIGLPQNQTLRESDPEIAVSPDGKRLVYVSGFGRTTQLILREFDQIEGRVLRGTNGATVPFFSPDGQWIGFQAGGELKKLSLDGGRPIPLCDARLFMGGSWGQDDVIYFSPGITDGLWKISADGGTPERITTPDEGELGHWWPEVLPGGGAVLFTIWKTSLNDISIAVYSRETRKWQTLLNGGSHARYAPTGHLLYAQSGTLMAAPFDLKQLKVGEPRKPVIKNLNQIADGAYAPFCFSTEGLVYYVQGGDWLARRNIVWVDRHTGDVIEPLPLDPGAYSSPRLSPDGQRIAFTKFDSGTINIWVYDSSKGPPEKVTFVSNNFFPIWKPDDNKLTFTSWRDGQFNVYWKPEGMNSPEEPLVTGEYDRRATSWSPDGKALLFNEINPETGRDIWCCSFEDQESEPLLNTRHLESEAVFSPDGRWIAYESDREEGRVEVYVASYPEPVVNKKISTDGGYHPAWSADGKELFYRNGDEMIAASIETEPELTTKSGILFRKQYYTSKYRDYDASRDGKRFLMIKESEEQPAATQLIAVHNWFEELRRLVPVRGTP